MKFLKLYLPVILLVIYWLLFKMLDTCNINSAVYIILIISLGSMIFIAIKLFDDNFKNMFIMIIIYNIINYILAKILYVDGWFLEGIEYAVVWGGFLGISIIYFIITGLKILSSEKK